VASGNFSIPPRLAFVFLFTPLTTALKGFLKLAIDRIQCLQHDMHV